VVTGGEIELPAIRAEQVLFGRVPLDRDAWVALWERGAGGRAGSGVETRTPTPGAALPEVQVLPEAVMS
jgi:hypothetical protein